MNNNPSFPHDDNILARFFGRSSNYTDIPNQLFKEHNVKKGLRNEDGTGVRDYIHVVDLALGHLKALEKHHNEAGFHVYNLGMGRGYSVLDMVNAFETTNNVRIPCQFVARRPGDIASYYSDPTKAFKMLGWKTERDIHQMVKDSWHWQKNNPNGYKDK